MCKLVLRFAASEMEFLARRRLLQAGSKIQARSLRIGCTDGEQSSLKGQKNGEVCRDKHCDMAGRFSGPTASPNAGTKYQ